MSISIFDLFSIGVGPSSSHTVGPMRAAKVFLESLSQPITAVQSIQITLYGSLAFTGKGHGTDKAILAGLCGFSPESVAPETLPIIIDDITTEQQINLLNQHVTPFNIEQDLIYNLDKQLEHHSNGMLFSVTFTDGTQVNKTYFSIGGGFILSDDEIGQPPMPVDLKYPFSSAADLLKICQEEHLNIAEVMLANETYWNDESAIRKKLLGIADIMHQCIENGCHNEGLLEGRLNVRRRAPALYKRLLAEGKPGPSHPQAMSWLNVFAMAVNEENAAGGRVVTAPTNGAAGIIPAVLEYYRVFYRADNARIVKFLLTAGAIGILYKKNASISGAEMGCQGEVGVACSMAAGALAAVLGANVQQVENAAEIGMEHNLGLTCDPIDGLVQIPCIERNAMGAVKAVNAAQLALAEDGQHNVSLDAVIKTMFEIGTNMNSIYKETSLGGLAVNVIEC